MTAPDDQPLAFPSPEPADPEVVTDAALPPGCDPELPAHYLEVRQPDELATFASRLGIDSQVELANALKDFVVRQELSVRIGDGEHLKVEAWQWLGSQLGIFARTVEAREIQSAELELVGYEATVEAVHRATGDVVGRAVAICAADEQQSRWGDDPDRPGRRVKRYQPRWVTAGVPVRHAMMSMAQTRATSKALSQALRFVVVMAGYRGTPSEEMSGIDVEGGARQEGGTPNPRSGPSRTGNGGAPGGSRAQPSPSAADSPGDEFIGDAQAATLLGIASRRAVTFPGVSGSDILNDIAHQKNQGDWGAMWPRIRMRQMKAVSAVIQAWEPPVGEPEPSE